ncbi:universal stress protein PHOS34-like [Iris pallida]|uniref:Universal stress protein PHOS34-like n=1 Tax=Iris pallida TaxID=29817 RepID=A0AAX6G6D8_IRIPA|nr:universal stress protein PHOS34-like [Iris pallida]KAJ6849066.1 universal stress protein PHOS34-like [Iris pallida]
MASESSNGRMIVVAVDQSEESLHALTWCLRNVVGKSNGDDENTKDTLVLLYAQPPRTVYPSIDGTGYLFSSDVTVSMDRYAKEMADGVTARARAVCSNNPRVKVETRIEVGDPRDVICEVVEKLGADMLVMGSHGYGLIKRTFLGSVSNHCAQKAKCPVLIVKRPKQ